MKPGHHGGYSHEHADLCERTLVTLLRGLGRQRGRGIYLIGGLVPRYILPPAEAEGPEERHVGTTDVDLVLALPVLADVTAYTRLETRLKRMGFTRGRNEDGQFRHYSWWKTVDET